MAKKIEFDAEIVKKYLFWFGIPIASVVAVLAGLLAISSVATELDRQKTALDTQKTAIQNLRGTAPTHPNQGTIDSIQAERDKLAENVLAAWEIMVQAQQEQNVWEGLAAADINEIRGKNFLDPLSSSVVNSYLNFAQSEINKLLDKTNIRRVERRDRTGNSLEQHNLVSTAGSGSSGLGTRQTTLSGIGAAGSAAADAVMRGKVVWNTPQLDITLRDWTRQPQPYEVWLTQEDLWVYQALLWVVAESNKNAPENSVPIGGRTTGGTAAGGGQLLDLSGSPIKEIVELSIGQQAANRLANQASRRIGRGSGGYGSSSIGSSDSGSGSTSAAFGRGGGSSAGGGAGQTQEAALAGRYVDADGTPLMTPVLTGQLRRMPVYLRFVVDQNRVPEVLVNCANCPMPIDVLWVTYNPEAGQSFDFVSATRTATAGSGSGSDSSSGSTSFAAARPARPTAGGTGAARTPGAGGVNYGPNAVTIEIFGCINIFAPPDKATLGGGTRDIL